MLREAIEHHGCPEMILVDRGKQFKAKGFLDICQALQIQVRYCGARHPQTKGKIERFFRTLRKEYIRVHTFVNLTQANEHLQTYLRNYNYVFTHDSLGDRTLTVAFWTGTVGNCLRLSTGSCIFVSDACVARSNLMAASCWISNATSSAQT